MKVKVAQLCPTLCDPMDYTVHEFSRPEYWSGDSPGDLPNPVIKPRSPALQADTLPGKPKNIGTGCHFLLLSPYNAVQKAKMQGLPWRASG